jgi:hypothetical protein
VTVEALVQVTNFPYAVAAGGSADLQSINVEAAQSMAQYAGGMRRGQVTGTLPASIGVDGALTAHGYVSGDVVYDSTVNVGGLKVGGSIRQGQVDLPQISVPTLEAGIPAAAETPPPAPVAGDVTLGSTNVYYVNPSVVRTPSPATST